MSHRTFTGKYGVLNIPWMKSGRVSPMMEQGFQPSQPSTPFEQCSNLVEIRLLQYLREPSCKSCFSGFQYGPSPWPEHLPTKPDLSVANSSAGIIFRTRCSAAIVIETIPYYARLQLTWSGVDRHLSASLLLFHPVACGEQLIPVCHTQE